MRPSRLHPAAVLAATALTAALLTACAPAADDEGTIALLLPDAKTARYETFDRPVFEERVAELGDFRVLYSNADQDAAKQQQQAESALAAGTDVLVLDPVDGNAAVSIVAAANAQGVPVIAYDRMISGGELAYHVSFDNEKVGQLQAETLVAGLDAAEREDAGILMINGSPTDSNAALFRAGAREVLDAAGVSVLGQISQFGDRIAAVYAANDGTASGAVSALKAANVAPYPLVTGQDAELTALQRILTGDQYMTVYKAIKPQARLAAEVAVTLVRGDEVTAPTEIDGVPTTLLEPVAVTVDTIADTVIADGFWRVEDICTPAYAAACAAAGLR